MAIPPTASRWIEGAARDPDGMCRKIESDFPTADDDALAKEFAVAQTFLTESQETARTRDESDQVELLLGDARLNLIPKVGKPRQVHDSLDRSNGMNLTAPQRAIEPGSVTR